MKTVLLAIVDAIVEAFGPEGADDLLSEEGAEAQLGAAEALKDKALKEALGDGKITYEQYLQLKAQKPADAVQSLNEIFEQKGGT